MRIVLRIDDFGCGTDTSRIDDAAQGCCGFLGPRNSLLDRTLDLIQFCDVGLDELCGSRGGRGGRGRAVENGHIGVGVDEVLYRCETETGGAGSQFSACWEESFGKTVLTHQIR